MMNTIQHYRFTNEFHEICKPIFAMTPITFCSMGRLFQDGTYTSFMSDPEWTDFYLKKHYHPTLHFWLEGELSQREVGYGLWSMTSLFTRNEALKSLQDDCAAFNYHNGINIIDTHPTYFELIRFSSSKKEGIETYFLENQDNLRNLILYLKEKIHSNKLLLNEWESHYQLPRHLNHDLLCSPATADNPDLTVQKYYVGFPLRENTYLTQQEIRCLIPYLVGMPKQDIAKQHHISVRTVEKHIEKVKAKSVCDQSTMLRSLFLNNRYISALTPNILKSFMPSKNT